MMYVSIFILSVGTFLLAWFRFRYAVGFLLLALPTYLIRFKIGPLPTTFLEIVWGGVFLVWLIKYVRTDFFIIVKRIKERPWFFVSTALLFVGSLIGVGVSDMVVLSLGQWRAYFLEPILTFFMLIGRIEWSTDTREGRITPRFLLQCLIATSLSVVLYSIGQWFTGFGIATPEWTAKATRRVTAFFTSPNAVGLYLETLVVFTFGYYVLLRQKKIEFSAKHASWSRMQMIVIPIIIGLQLLAIVFTKSDGTILALGAALIVSLFLAGYKKIVAGLIIVAIVTAIFVPKIQSVLLFRDKSGENRLTLWTYSWEFLTASPKNFVAGAGVRQFFRKIQKPHYDVKKMERLIYPHNFIFNFWSETGLLGLIGFISILGCLARYALAMLRVDRTWGILLLSVLVVIIVHGLVDVPYFKNDLALLFWIIVSPYIARPLPTTSKK